MNLTTEAKTERIDIRTTARAKRLLQDAATAKSKTVSEFVLDVALAEAAEALAERRLFMLDESEWKTFQAALDAPTAAKPRLAALLDEPSVLE